MSSPTTNRLSRVPVRHQISFFVVITMVLSWMFIPLADGGLLPHGPMLAGFLVLIIVSGRQGAAGLWRQVTKWRVSWAWYLIAPGILLAIHFLALALSPVIGIEVASPRQLLTAGTVLGIWVPLVLLGGQWEEPGWLGYLLRRLQEMAIYSPLLVMLIAGLIRMVWHTPLLVLGTIPWFDYLFGTFALQIILMWLYNRTGGSVLLPMICHLFSNLTSATFRPLVEESDRGLYWLTVTIIKAAVALGIVLATRGRLGLAR